MRRALCAFLILLCWLGPLADVLPATAESRLPACCRRHGAHHCAMAAAMAAMAARVRYSSAPALSVPSHCSSYPDNLVASTEPVQALSASPAHPPASRTEACSPAPVAAAVRASNIRNLTSRGPPIA